MVLCGFARLSWPAQRPHPGDSGDGTTGHGARLKQQPADFNRRRVRRGVPSACPPCVDSMGRKKKGHWRVGIAPEPIGDRGGVPWLSEGTDVMTFYKEHGFVGGAPSHMLARKWSPISPLYTHASFGPLNEWNELRPFTPARLPPPIHREREGITAKQIRSQRVLGETALLGWPAWAATTNTDALYPSVRRPHSNTCAPPSADARPPCTLTSSHHTKRPGAAAHRRSPRRNTANHRPC